MPAFIWYIILTVAGVAAVAIVVGRYVPSVRKLPEADQRKWVDRLPLFFTFLSEFLQAHVQPPLMRFWSGHAHPMVLGEGERWSRKVRIFALKVERFFHQLSDYFRGKRIEIQAGGHPMDAAQGKNSQFWNEIQRLKSSLSHKKDHSV